MTIAFTLCSNNYLAQAKVLSESFKKHHPNIEFVIGLVDTCHPEVDYTSFSQVEILPVSNLNIPNFNELERKYNIIELNTSVKPYYFSYFFKNRNAEKIIYLDPDTVVFSPLTEALELLNNHNIILTPQNCQPIDDGESPSDIHLLGTGVFNLGFIALSFYQNVEGFLNWWTERLFKYGFADERNNMFFDQVWINLVPVFFDNYYILKHPGYNMSPSNLHGRKISPDANMQWEVNKTYPLRFYHFSGFRYTVPDLICSYSKRFTFKSRPELLPLYSMYTKLLLKHNIENLSGIQPVYCRKDSVPNKRDDKIKKGLRRISRAISVLAGKS